MILYPYHHSTKKSFFSFWSAQKWSMCLFMFCITIIPGFSQKSSVTDTFKYEILLDAPDKTPRFFLGLDFYGLDTDLENHIYIQGGGIDLNYFPSPKSWIKANGFIPFGRAGEVYDIGGWGAPKSVDFPLFRRLEFLHTWYFSSNPKRKQATSILGTIPGGAYNTSYYFNFDITKTVRFGLRTGLFHYNHFLGEETSNPISRLSDGTDVFFHGYSANNLSIGISRAKAINFVVRNRISGIERKVKFRHWYADLLWNVGIQNSFHRLDTFTQETLPMEANLDIPVIRPGFRVGFESMIKLAKMNFGGFHINWEYSFRPRPVLRTIPPLEDRSIGWYTGHLTTRFGFYLYAPENF